MDDSLLGLQEQADTAISRIEETAKFEPMRAALYGVVEANRMLLSLVTEIALSLSPDEHAVMHEAASSVRDVLTASAKAVPR